MLKEVQEAARALGVQIQVLRASRDLILLKCFGFSRGRQHGLDLPDEKAAKRYGEDLASRFEAPVEVIDVSGKVLARYPPKE